MSSVFNKKIFKLTNFFKNSKFKILNAPKKLARKGKSFIPYQPTKKPNQTKPKINNNNINKKNVSIN